MKLAQTVNSQLTMCATTADDNIIKPSFGLNTNIMKDYFFPLIAASTVTIIEKATTVLGFRLDIKVLTNYA